MYLYASPRPNSPGSLKIAYKFNNSRNRSEPETIFKIRKESKDWRTVFVDRRKEGHLAMAFLDLFRISGHFLQWYILTFEPSH